MAYIKWVEDEEAEGVVAEAYGLWRQANPGRTRMPEILKCLPDWQEVQDQSDLH